MGDSGCNPNRARRHILVWPFPLLLPPSNDNSRALRFDHPIVLCHRSLCNPCQFTGEDHCLPDRTTTLGNLFRSPPVVPPRAVGHKAAILCGACNAPLFAPTNPFCLDSPAYRCRCAGSCRSVCKRPSGRHVHGSAHGPLTHTFSASPRRIR